MPREPKTGYNCVPGAVLMLWKASCASKKAVHCPSTCIEGGATEGLVPVLLLASHTRESQDRRSLSEMISFMTEFSL